MLERVEFVQPLAQNRAPFDEVERGVIIHVAEVLLDVDNGVEITAIGDIDFQTSEVRAFDFKVWSYRGKKERW